MRYIPPPNPRFAPDRFKRWKRKHPGAKYDRFRDSLAKAELKAELVRRQKFICCYCESRITFASSHIEHIEPQYGGVSDKTMDFSNMAASCIKDPKHYEELRKLTAPERNGGTASVLHCGHARGCHAVVSPYEPRCERFFSYSFSGEIKVNPALERADEIALARESIEFLRLNVSQLVTLRALAMYETVKMLESGLSAPQIFLEISGRLPPYVSAASAAIKAWKRAKVAREEQ